MKNKIYILKLLFVIVVFGSMLANTIVVTAAESSELEPAEASLFNIKSDSWDQFNNAIVEKTGETVADDYLATINAYFDERLYNLFGETISDNEWEREEQLQRMGYLSHWADSCSFTVNSAEVTSCLMDLLDRTEKEDIFLVREYLELQYTFEFEEAPREMEYENIHVIHMSKDDHSIISDSYIEMVTGYCYGKDNELKYLFAFGEIPWEDVKEDSTPLVQNDPVEMKSSETVIEIDSDDYCRVSGNGLRLLSLY